MAIFTKFSELYFEDGGNGEFHFAFFQATKFKKWRKVRLISNRVVVVHLFE